MKLKLVPQTRLTSSTRVTPEGRGLGQRTKGLSMRERKENLYRAIEATQAFMHKKTSPKPVMDAIRDHYPAPLFFIESNRRALEGIGLARLDAFYYAMIPALTRTSLAQRWGMHPRLDKLPRMAEYLRALYVGVHVECFYLVLLDGRGNLIRSVLLQKGGVDNAPFYLGQVLSSALMESAKYIVLAHNHPGGTRNPSKEDLACTLRALNAFAPLKIPLLDHLIVARTAVVSIRGTGLVPEILWTAAAGGNRIVANWLDGAFPILEE